LQGQRGFYRCGVGLHEHGVDQWQQLEKSRPRLCQLIVPHQLAQRHELLGLQVSRSRNGTGRTEAQGVENLHVFTTQHLHITAGLNYR